MRQSFCGAWISYRPRKVLVLGMRCAAAAAAAPPNTDMIVLRVPRSPNFVSGSNFFALVKKGAVVFQG